MAIQARPDASVCGGEMESAAASVLDMPASRIRPSVGVAEWDKDKRVAPLEHSLDHLLVQLTRTCDDDLSVISVA